MPSTETMLVPILIADDDEEDRMLAEDALTESRLANPLYFVADGVELLDFLYRRGRYENPESAPRPGLILLDINMPRMTGLEALREIKRDAELRRIPVVILTTSRADEDIIRSYDLGVNSFISKPVTFEGLVDVMRLLGTYWFEIVDLAPEDR
jgi:two-component system, response regulator